MLEMGLKKRVHRSPPGREREDVLDRGNKCEERGGGSRVKRRGDHGNKGGVMSGLNTPLPALGL